MSLVLLDEPRNTGDGAAGSDAGDENIDFAVGVVPDFRSGCLEVNFRVGGILKLLRHVEVWVFGNFGRLVDRPLHAIGSRREDQRCTERTQHQPSFARHGVGHGERERVTASGANIRQRNARVAAGRLDDLHSRFEYAALFGIPIFASTVALSPSVKRLMRISGVLPIDSELSL